MHLGEIGIKIIYFKIAMENYFFPMHFHVCYLLASYYIHHFSHQKRNRVRLQD